ncbi:hypothetical protein ACU5AX_09130 [Sphingomonas sp. XXL09]|uniref:hypothetical protein n=1 Tax=Sphingomonas sp. XXL09 TaxID=3457787 RepID=UPI00406BDB03
MAVKFLKPCQQGTLYNKDEVASFDKDVEARLIEQKFAERHSPKAEKAAAAASTAPAA